MSALRESHELFNKIADVIDFQPDKYNQRVWGEAATQFVGDDYIHWDPVNQELDDLDVNPEELLEDNRVDDACGTAACVAGWACLLSNYHPTIQKIEIQDNDNADIDYSHFFPTSFRKFGSRIFSIFTDRISYNYNVMCSIPGVITPMHPEKGRTVTMEDCGYEGVKVDNMMFYRPDYLGQDLLALDDYEAGTLFDADTDWDGDALRRIGKGEDVGEVLEEYNQPDIEGCYGDVDNDEGVE